MSDIPLTNPNFAPTYSDLSLGRPLDTESMLMIAQNMSDIDGLKMRWGTGLTYVGGNLVASATRKGVCEGGDVLPPQELMESCVDSIDELGILEPEAWEPVNSKTMRLAVVPKKTVARVMVKAVDVTTPKYESGLLMLGEGLEIAKLYAPDNQPTSVSQRSEWYKVQVGYAPLEAHQALVERVEQINDQHPNGIPLVFTAFDVINTAVRLLPNFDS